MCMTDTFNVSNYNSALPCATAYLTTEITYPVMLICFVLNATVAYSSLFSVMACHVTHCLICCCYCFRRRIVVHFGIGNLFDFPQNWKYMYQSILYVCLLAMIVKNHWKPQDIICWCSLWDQSRGEVWLKPTVCGLPGPLFYLFPCLLCEPCWEDNISHRKWNMSAYMQVTFLTTTLALHSFSFTLFFIRFGTNCTYSQIFPLSSVYLLFSSLLDYTKKRQLTSYYYFSQLIISNQTENQK